MTITELEQENFAAESDVRIAVEKMQMQLQKEQNTIAGNSIVDKATGLIQRQLLNDCTNHLIKVIHQSVHTLPDEEFHKRVYDARQHQTELSEIDANKNKTDDAPGNTDLSDDDDCSCTSDIDDEELVDIVAVEQVQKLREQLRIQAQINNKKRSMYLATTSKIIEIEQMIFLRQNSQMQTHELNDNNDEKINANVEESKIMLQEMQQRLAKLQESLLACDEGIVTAASDRLSETIQEVKRNFIIQDQIVNSKDGTILFPSLKPLSQVEEAIARREEDDEFEIEQAKNNIIYASTNYAASTTKASTADELDSMSPQKEFLDMIM